MTLDQRHASFLELFRTEPKQYSGIFSRFHKENWGIMDNWNGMMNKKKIISMPLEPDIRTWSPDSKEIRKTVEYRSLSVPYVSKNEGFLQAQGTHQLSYEMSIYICLNSSRSVRKTASMEFVYRDSLE